MKFGTVCPKHCTTPFYQIEPAGKTPDVTPDTLASSGNQYYKNTIVSALVFRSIIDPKTYFFFPKYIFFLLTCIIRVQKRKMLAPYNAVLKLALAVGLGKR